MSNILIIAAHPDDEVLGCGGTIARLNQEGHDVYTLILGEGITSRKGAIDRIKVNKEVKELQEFAVRANKLLGVKEVIFNNFPDNRFDSVSLLDIVKEVETVIDSIKPNIIFTL